MKTRAMGLRRAFVCALVLCSAMSASAGPFELISVRDSAQAAPAGGSGDSWGPVVSSNGRYILFASTANNLAPNSNSNSIPVFLAPKLNVYWRDRASGTTMLVSVNLWGTGGGNGDSVPTGVSADGRYALFESSASDLVPSDTNDLTDVFLRDLASNLTSLVSVSTNGTAGNGVCRGSTMTPDARFIAFTSAANNLVPADTNGIPDVFVRDMQSGMTTLASVGAQATNQYSLIGSEAPDITPDGRYVAFFTAAGNLVPGVANGGEIYVRDLVAATTTWASQGALAFLGASNIVSFNHAISADGRFVAYEACSNLAPPSVSARGLILRFRLDTGLTDLVNTNACVQTANLEEIHSLDMTPDGRFITFVANTNVSSGTTCVYLWDAQSTSSTLVSGSSNGTVSANSICDWPAVDATGRFIAFLSSATNLVTNSLVGSYHLYLRDTQSGTTTLVDADINGVGSSVLPSSAPRLSPDGSLVAFECLDANLVANDRNHDYDVFLRDLSAGSIELISAHHPAFPSASANGPSAVSTLSASANGRFVAFTSDADNLVPYDTNGFRDIFVRDLELGTNLLVSVGTNGVGADGISTEPAISADGRFVAFTSSADNLVAGDTNKSQDVFVRDLQTGTTTLVSVNTSGAGSGNKASYSPVISTAGRFVLFRSQANNLGVAPYSPSGENLFLRDLQASVAYVLTLGGLISASMTPDGRFVAFADAAGAVGGRIYVWDSSAGARVETNFLGQTISALALSSDGSRIACFIGSNTLAAVDRLAGTNGSINTAYPGPRPGLRFSDDGRFLAYVAAPALPATNQVYLYDFQARTNLLLSFGFGSAFGANGSSDSPAISADGRFVAYRSFATNLLSVADNNGVPDLFLYDRFSGTSSLLTTSRFTGLPADNRSLNPVFSGDGRTLFFQSWADDLVPQDFNHGDDVFALALLYASISSVPGQGPTLTWPARPGETYQVQFKANLDEPVWQNVTGTVTVSGNHANLTDVAPSAEQRFYRVVAF
jgi:Tol biopolymer transport system component